MKENSTKVIRTYKSPNEKLIDFAFRLYAEPDVEDLCLHLQNEYHMNVNILLWTCWLKSESIAIDTRWLDDVLISIDTISQLTVSRLQEVRRVIKNSAGFTRVQAQVINKHILGAELAAEKVFLQRMQDLTSKFLESQATVLGPEEDILEPSYYLDFLHIPRAKERAELLLSFCKSAEIVMLHPNNK